MLSALELRGWREKLGSGAPADGPQMLRQDEAVAAAQDGSGVEDGEAREFGWELGFVAPDEGMSALQLLGMGADANVGLGGAQGLGQGEPSPEELRALAARGVQKAEQRQQQQQSGAGTFSLFAEEEEEEDLGREYEEGKRLREVRTHVCVCVCVCVWVYCMPCGQMHACSSDRVNALQFASTQTTAGRQHDCRATRQSTDHTAVPAARLSGHEAEHRPHSCACSTTVWPRGRAQTTQLCLPSTGQPGPPARTPVGVSVRRTSLCLTSLFGSSSQVPPA